MSVTLKCNSAPSTHAERRSPEPARCPVAVRRAGAPGPASEMQVRHVPHRRGPVVPSGEASSRLRALYVSASRARPVRCVWLTCPGFSLALTAPRGFPARSLRGLVHLCLPPQPIGGGRPGRRASPLPVLTAEKGLGKWLEVKSTPSAYGGSYGTICLCLGHGLPTWALNCGR